MITYFTSAYFAGLSITEHIELNPDTQKEFIKFIKNISENNNYKNWEIAKGRLFCNDIDFNSPKELWFTKINFKNYKIRLDFAAVDLGKDGYVGFYLAYKNGKNYIKLILNGSQIEIEKNINGSKQKNKYSLPENFDIKNLHTLLIKKIDGSMLVVLDNYNLFQEQSVITHEILGFTCIGSSYFEGIEITKL